MKSFNQVTRLIFLGLLLIVVFQVGIARSDSDDAPQPAPAPSADGLIHLPNSRNQIIKLTDHGLEPSVIRMNKEDSILFFLNDSTDSLATLSIDFGKRVVHCGGGNLRAGEDGKVTTTYPIEPRNFATTCFHEPGSYKFHVFGLNNNPNGLEASVIVE